MRSGYFAALEDVAESCAASLLTVCTLVAILRSPDAPTTENVRDEAIGMLDRVLLRTRAEGPKP